MTKPDSEVASASAFADEVTDDDEAIALMS